MTRCQLYFGLNAKTNFPPPSSSSSVLAGGQPRLTTIGFTHHNLIYVLCFTLPVLSLETSMLKGIFLG